MLRIAPALVLAFFLCVTLPAALALGQTCPPPGQTCAHCNPNPGSGQPECIPVSGSRLVSMFSALEDGRVDAFEDGNPFPQTFVPDCQIEFRLILRNAWFNNVFGWYNVTGSAPPEDLNHLFPILDSGAHCANWDDRCDSAGNRNFSTPGDVVTVDIASDPNYAGGEIGFFLKTPEGCGHRNASVGNGCGHLYFSEQALNEDGGAYIHLLIYNSETERGFYFAWEDLYAGGDNDFGDLVTFVSNIVCSGAGAPCEVPGAEGICANGTMQCRSGTLQCVAQRQPMEEVCNGLDDDCNGEIDDGDLCGPTQICRFGRCIQRCLGTEVACNLGFTCVEGVCVEFACADVTCAPGQRCLGGDCVDACTGVVCPTGQVCDPLVSACVDPCEGLVCDGDQVCVDGVCQPHCDCQPLRCEQQSLTCGGDGQCQDEACVGVTCRPGQRCEAGSCVDGCLGVTCPASQRCMNGRCLPDPGGSTEDPGAGGSGGDGGLGADGGLDGSGASGDSSGCGCSVPGAAAGGLPGGAALALLALLGLWRRRRSLERIS
jgi:MYXO-CTERM domain-containing protein